MKVALVHDWLTGMRGGEYVLEALCEMFPSADLYTLVHVPGSVSSTIENRRIRTSFLQKFPGSAKRYRWFLPLMPRAIESFELKGYDLVISSSHCVAKGIRAGGAPHLCYCHTPMRYAWDMYAEYFNPARFNRLTLRAIEKIMPGLRRWDVRTVTRVERWVANSRYVADRIHRLYKAQADVAYPPVDVDFYTPGDLTRRESYLVVSAFAPYKRIDLAIKTFVRRAPSLLLPHAHAIRLGYVRRIFQPGPVQPADTSGHRKNNAWFATVGRTDSYPRGALGGQFALRGGQDSPVVQGASRRGLPASGRGFLHPR